MKLNYKPVKTLVAGLALLTLGGCAAGNKLESVALPNPPECMNPVPVPNVKAGDDARLALLKTDKALGQANGRLVCSRKWYREVQRSYSPSQ